MRSPLRHVACLAALAALLAGGAQADGYDFATPASPGMPRFDVSDADHVPTREMVPAIAPGWQTQMQWDEDVYRRFHGKTPSDVVDAEARLNAKGLTYAARYHGRDGLYVEVDHSDLLYPVGEAELDHATWKPMRDGQHIVLSITIIAYPPEVTVNLPLAGLVTDCGPGVAADANGLPAYQLVNYGAYLNARSDTPDPRLHHVLLLIDGDPRKVTGCTLHLAAAVTRRSGELAPDLRMTVIDGWHSTVYMTP